MLLLSLHGSAQNLSVDANDAVEAMVLRQKHAYEMEMYRRFTDYRYKPYVGLSFAFPRFYGDVMPTRGQRSVSDLATMWGVNVGVSIDESERFLLSLHTLMGSLRSYRQDYSSALPMDNLRFSTRIMQLDASLTYQPRMLFHLVYPYVRTGVGVMRFNPMGNLKDARDSSYQYLTGSSAVREYDKTYETDLRKSSNGSYALTAPVIPLELGMGFAVGSFFNIRLAYLFTYAFTDFLDNVRSGKLNDAYGGFQVSLQVRPFTSTRSIHNRMYGRKLSPSELANYQKVVLEHDADAPKSRFMPNDSVEAAVYKRRAIPRRLKSVDSNNDGIISSIEMNNAIEQYQMGSYSKLKRRDILKLQEFYRSQLE